MHLPAFGEIVLMKDRRLVLGPATQALLPMKYKWLYDIFKKANNNFWLPEEISMGDDKYEYTQLEPNVRRFYDYLFSMLTTMDLVVTDALESSIMPYASAPEFRSWLALQGYQECLSLDTQVLTPTGWVYVSELSGEELLCQWDKDKEELSFAQPRAISRSFVQNACLFKSKRGYVNQLVSENHRVVTVNRSGKKEVKHAKEVVNNYQLCFINTGRTGGSEFGRVFCDEDRLRIAIQADGSINGRYTGARTGTIQVQFGLTKSRKKCRLENLLDKMGVGYTSRVYPSRPEHTNYFVRVPVRLATKDFSSWVDLQEVSPGWCAQFIDEALQWDGNETVPNPQVGSYASNNVVNAEILQTIATFAGYRTTWFIQDNGEYRPTYTVCINRDRNTTWVTRKESVMETQEYNDWMVGIEVPASFLLIRRNGAISVTGNSIHSHAYTLIAEEIAGDQDLLFGMYLTEKPIYDKIAMAGKYNNILDEASVSIDPVSTIQDFILGYSFWAIMLEGIWFFLGLSIGTYPSSQLRKMRGTADQFQYIRRDENLHYHTGISIIQGIIAEYPEAWTPDLKERIVRMVEEGLMLEQTFAETALVKLPGLTPSLYMQECRYQAMTLCRRLGIDIYPGTKPALKWLTESVALRKESNFFERRPSEYRVGSDLWSEEGNDNDGWDDPLKGIK